METHFLISIILAGSHIKLYHKIKIYAQDYIARNLSISLQYCFYSFPTYPIKLSFKTLISTTRKRVRIEQKLAY